MTNTATASESTTTTSAASCGSMLTSGAATSSPPRTPACTGTISCQATTRLSARRPSPADRWTRRNFGRSFGRSACATRGAWRSIPTPANCTPATPATTCARRSTLLSAAAITATPFSRARRRGRGSIPPPSAMTIFSPRPSTAAHTATTSPVSSFIAATGRRASTGTLYSPISRAAGSARWISAATPTTNARSAVCFGMTTFQHWARIR